MIPEIEKIQRLIKQLLKQADRATPGPWKYREQKDNELGSYGDVHSLADRKVLRARQTMVCETAWLEDGVFCCDARDYFVPSLKAIQEIVAYCLLTTQAEGAQVSPHEILGIIQKELVVESDPK